MSEVDRTAPLVVSDETIRMAGEVLITLMRQQNLSNVEVAAQAGIERSHLSRVRNGKAPITANIVGRLIPCLNVDRSRLVMAVCVMRNPSYYFDLRFQNAAYCVEHMLSGWMEMPPTDIGAHIFSSLSKEGCETFAAQMVAAIRSRFSQVPDLMIRPSAAG